jgi:hypothetical protein
MKRCLERPELAAHPFALRRAGWTSITTKAKKLLRDPCCFVVAVHSVTKKVKNAEIKINLAPATCPGCHETALDLA